MDRDKSEIKKIGILGGSFDPAHKGHVKISIEAKKRYKLHEIIWAVTKKNPLKKKPMMSLKKRILLSRKIAQSLKKIKIKSYDNRIKSSETINLIKFLKNNEKNVKYYFLIGSDNLQNFHKWKKYGCNC